MRRISSSMTFFYKRVFPLLWFGFLLIFMFVSVFLAPHADFSATLPFVFVPAAMMIFGIYLMKKLVFDLVDEVWEDNEALLVKNAGQQQTIAFTDIKNVSYASMTSPPRVTLSLRQPSVFGDQIVFCAPVRLLPLASSPVIDDLINRIDRARQGHG